MKYAIEQRLRLIDFLLANYGHINREQLIDYFGVSIQQASNDIKAYLEMAGDNAVYCKKSKMYKKSETFIRVFE